MKQVKAMLVLVGFLFIGVSAQAEFVAGEDYLVLKPRVVEPSDKVVVTEFFHYGCPYCERIEPKLKAWRLKNKNRVDFQPVAVNFNERSDFFAKIHYSLVALKVADRYTDEVFELFKTKGKDIHTAEDFANAMEKNSLDTEAFLDAYYHSPSVDMLYRQGKKQTADFKIYSVPTLVVAQQYQLSLKNTNGDIDQLIKVLDHLVSKAQSQAAANNG